MLGSDQLKMACNPSLFSALRKAGVKVAMCTNDTRARAKLMLEHFDLTKDFDLIVARKLINFVMIIFQKFALTLAFQTVDK